MTSSPFLLLRTRPRAWFWRSPAVTLLVVAMLAAGSALAHDFWVEAGIYHPAAGATVPLTLHVGENFKGDSVVFNPEHFNRFIVAGPGGEKPVSGTLCDDPAGSIATPGKGLYAVLFESKKFDVAFESFGKFEAYLKEEGLERHSAFAKARAGGGGKIVEVYSRCAKALIAAEPVDDSAADRSLGCALELVADTHPWRSGRADDLKLHLLFRNKPVEGVLVVAFNKADPSQRLKMRTDKDGRVAFKLPRTGVWLVKAVHMTLLGRFTRGDWESFWASLTFEAR